jgi:hypothetical protein
LLLERINQNGHDILKRSNEHDSAKLSAKLASLDEKWKSMITLLTSLKAKFVAQQQSESGNQHSSPSKTESNDDVMSSTSNVILAAPLTTFQILTNKFAEQSEWLAKCDQLINTNVSPVDELETERLTFEIKV